MPCFFDTYFINITEKPSWVSVNRAVDFLKILLYYKNIAKNGKIFFGVMIDEIA
jgi:hypothetical protein